MGVRSWFESQSLPVLIAMDVGLAILLAVDIVVPDILPALDELALGWLLVTSGLATWDVGRAARSLPAAAPPSLPQAPPEPQDPVRKAAEQEVDDVGPV